MPENVDHIIAAENLKINGSYLAASCFFTSSYNFLSICDIHTFLLWENVRDLFLFSVMKRFTKKDLSS